MKTKTKKRRRRRRRRRRGGSCVLVVVVCMHSLLQLLMSGCTHIHTFGALTSTHSFRWWATSATILESGKNSRLCGEWWMDLWIGVDWLCVADRLCVFVLCCVYVCACVCVCVCARARVRACVRACLRAFVLYTHGHM
jgi:hypothetical protein